jgi:hypothetical protein
MKKNEERLYCRAYVEALELDRDQLKQAMRHLDVGGIASGEQGVTYSLSERIDWLIKVKEYWQRKADALSKGAEKC